MFMLECVRPLHAHFQGNENVKHLFESPTPCVVACESASTKTSSATEPCVLVCGTRSLESEPLGENCNASDPPPSLNQHKDADEEHKDDCGKIAGCGSYASPCLWLAGFLRHGASYENEALRLRSDHDTTAFAPSTPSVTREAVPSATYSSSSSSCSTDFAPLLAAATDIENHLSASCDASGTGDAGLNLLSDQTVGLFRPRQVTKCATSSTPSSTLSVSTADSQRMRLALRKPDKPVHQQKIEDCNEHAKSIYPSQSPCSGPSHIKPKVVQELDRFDAAEVFRFVNKPTLCCLVLFCVSFETILGVSVCLSVYLALLVSRCLHRGANLTAGIHLDVVWCEGRDLAGTVTVAALLQTLKDSGVLVVSVGSLASRRHVQRALDETRSLFYCQNLQVV